MRMKLIFAASLFAASITAASAQNFDFGELQGARLRDIPSAAASGLKYDVAMKRRTNNTVDGSSVFAPSALKATVSIFWDDLDPESTVEWVSAGWGRMDDIRDEPAEFTPWPEFSGFRYKSRNADFLNAGFYEGIPADKSEWARMLATDIPWVDEMAWHVIDSLEYRKEFYPALMNDLDIKMENAFTFSSTYLRYLWASVTEHNGEPCAVVEFESLFNPMANGPVKGRSMYYGQMFVSLADKQIEYLRMVEDVFFSVPPGNMPFDMQRIVVFDKITEVAR